MLMESKAMLEEQLQSIKLRSDRLHHLEKHNLLLEAKLHDMEEVRKSKWMICCNITMFHFLFLPLQIVLLAA